LIRIVGLLLFLSLNSCSTNVSLTVAHYNIKELSTKKILDKNDQQVISAIKVLKTIKADILSLNEIQYDIKNTPTQGLPGGGKNIKRLESRGKIFSPGDWYDFLFPSNTGERARKMKNGDYAQVPNHKGRGLADPYNFGLFPHQYSMGLMSKYPVISHVFFKKLKWRDVFPNREIKEFLDNSGQKIKDDIELFDKGFADVVLKIGSREVHVILLHTTPAYHFGNEKTPNYARNADQLKFLEWYLTGETRGEINQNLGILPLEKNDFFIALGDWNLDWRSQGSEGHLILNSIFSKTTRATNHSLYTYEKEGFSNGNLKLSLDYIVVSNNIKVTKMGGGFTPLKRQYLGCDKLKSKEKFSKKRKIIKYRENGRDCHVLISIDEYHQKKGSDHFPIWAEISL